MIDRSLYELCRDEGCPFEGEHPRHKHPLPVKGRRGRPPKECVYCGSKQPRKGQRCPTWGRSLYRHPRRPYQNGQVCPSCRGRGWLKSQPLRSCLTCRGMTRLDLESAARLNRRLAERKASIRSCLSG